MVKREVVANVDVDAPRPKRRKESMEAPKSEDVEMAEAGGSSDVDDAEEKKAEDVSRSPEEVSELGLKVWHVVKDFHTVKEQRHLSPVFMRLPSKRQYPDYYDVIKQPIALEDIKARLDGQKYTSLDEVRADFELCFKNARRYNVRESQIWRDAKLLQKLVNKEIEKIIRPEGDEDGSDDEKKKKGGKGSNVNRMMKNRLQKLITTNDETGRNLSAAFMDLPSKKKWPLYYRIIKKPICFEDIFKKIKRKEYATVQDFMADVDLVFENAMEFNEDKSPVYEDARQLKRHFAQIMKDVLTQTPAHQGEQQQTIGKITLKVPNPHNIAASQDLPVAGPSNAALSRIPGAPVAGMENSLIDVVGTGDGVNKGKSPALAHPTLPSSNSITVPQRTSHTSPKGGAQNTASAVAAAAAAGLNALAQAAVAKSTPIVTSSTTVTGAQVQQQQQQVSVAQQSALFGQTPGGYYGATAQLSGLQQPQQQAQTPLAARRTSATPAPVPSRTTSAMSSIPGYSVSTPLAESSVAPPVTTTASTSTTVPTVATPTAITGAAISTPALAPQFRSVHITTMPLGRRISLDHDEGVLSWMLRLGRKESKVVLSGVEFLREEEDEEEEEQGEEEGAAGGAGAKGEEEQAKPDEEEEEEEEHAEEVPAAAPATTSPPRRKRGRGRPPKAKHPQPNGVDKDKENKAKSAASASTPTTTTATPATAATKTTPLRRSQRTSSKSDAHGQAQPPPTIEDVLVKLDGVQLSSRSVNVNVASPAEVETEVEAGVGAGAKKQEQTEWDIDVASGSHVLEVAQKSRGVGWRVYIERKA